MSLPYFLLYFLKFFEARDWGGWVGRGLTGWGGGGEERHSVKNLIRH